MGVKFLSHEWAKAVTETLNASDAFRHAAGSRVARVQNVVSTPEGERKYYFVLEGGQAQLDVGEIDAPDATVAQDYETAAALSRNELSGTAAFMSGKVRVTGDLMKLLQLQGVFSTVPDLIARIDVEY